jgi:MOSC domain-containing protein YiiM
MKRYAQLNGRLVALRYKDRSSETTRETTEARLIPDLGMEADARGGPGPRQLVLLSEEARRAVNEAQVPGLCYARFRENLLIAGLEPGELAPGTELVIGQARIRISEARKRCYPECELPHGDCAIRPGVAFAEVLQGGTIHTGDEVRRA